MSSCLGAAHVRALALLLAVSLFSERCVAGEAQGHYRYSISYSGIPVGQALVDISPEQRTDSLWTKRLVIDSETNRFASALFLVRNHYETTVDLASYRTLSFIARIHQSNMSQQLAITYDHSRRQAYRSGRPAYSIPNGVADVFGALLLAGRRIRRQGDSCAVIVDLGGLFCETTVIATAAEEVDLPVGLTRGIRATVRFGRVTGDRKRRERIDILTNRLAREGSAVLLWFSADGSGTLLKASYGRRPFVVAAELEEKRDFQAYPP